MNSEISNVHGLLRKYKIRPSRKLSQHFMVDTSVVNQIVKYARLHSGLKVIEVGAGLGALTSRLLASDVRVIAVEKDPKMVNVLQREYSSKQYKNLEIIEGDILQIELPMIDVVVGNLPYSITSPLLFRLLDHGFKRAVLTMQWEVAKRLIAKPKSRDYSRLTVSFNLRANSKILRKITPHAFYPKPKVWSAVVLIEPKPIPSIVDINAFNKILTALFMHRRKLVHKALRLGLKSIAPNVIINTEKLPYSGCRVYELTPTQILEFYKQIPWPKTDSFGE